MNFILTLNLNFIVEQVGLKSPIVIGDLQSNGVDFEIEDVLNEQSRELHKDELNELHDNDEYISVRKNSTL